MIFDCLANRMLSKRNCRGFEARRRGTGKNACSPNRGYDFENPMQAQLIDHVRIDSALHRLDARWKLAAVMPAMATIVALHTLPAAGIAFAASLALLIASQLPISW